MRRALVLLAVAAISLAASFGGPEEVDPQAAPETLGYGTVDQIGVDGSGRAWRSPTEARPWLRSTTGR